MTAFHAIKNITFEEGVEKKKRSFFLQREAWKGNQIARAEQTRQKGSLHMYKFLDLFLALRNQFCLTYTSAKAYVQMQNWMIILERNGSCLGKRARNIASWATQEYPDYLCKLTCWQDAEPVKQNKTKTNPETDLLKHQGLNRFCHRTWSLSLCSSSEKCSEHGRITALIIRHENRRMAAPSNQDLAEFTRQFFDKRQLLIAVEEQTNQRSVGMQVHIHKYKSYKPLYIQVLVHYVSKDFLNHT